MTKSIGTSLPPGAASTPAVTSPEGESARRLVEEAFPHSVPAVPFPPVARVIRKVVGEPLPEHQTLPQTLPPAGRFDPQKASKAELEQRLIAAAEAGSGAIVANMLIFASGRGFDISGALKTWAEATLGRAQAVTNHEELLGAMEAAAQRGDVRQILAGEQDLLAGAKLLALDTKTQQAIAIFADAQVAVSAPIAFARELEKLRVMVDSAHPRRVGEGCEALSRLDQDTRGKIHEVVMRTRAEAIADVRVAANQRLEMLRRRAADPGVDEAGRFLANSEAEQVEKELELLPER